MNTKKSMLMRIVEAAAARFDRRPEYRASIEARRELAGSAIRLSALLDDVAETTRLASQPGGVDVVDDDGRVVFRLVAPADDLELREVSHGP